MGLRLKGILGERILAQPIKGMTIAIICGSAFQTLRNLTGRFPGILLLGSQRSTQLFSDVSGTFYDGRPW